jgi:hypothetical protein
MAAPFGNHPTLFEYIAWCNQQGCTTRSILAKGEGGFSTLQIIQAQTGRHVIASGIAMTERLVPSQVAYFDRRLGLDSPFSKITGYTH